MSLIDIVHQAHKKLSASSRIVENDCRNVNPHFFRASRLHLEVKIRNAARQLVPAARGCITTTGESMRSHRIARLEHLIDVAMQDFIRGITKQLLSSLVP